MKMKCQERERVITMQKPRFNIVDFLIILAVVLVVVAGVYILGSKSETVVNTDKTKTQITIELKEVDKEAMNYYNENAKIGTAVTMGLREKVNGVLMEINSAPSTENFDNPVTGKKELVNQIGKYNLTFTIEAELSETDKDFLIGTDKIKIGKELNFAGKGFSGYGNVVIIKKVGGEE